MFFLEARNFVRSLALLYNCENDGKILGGFDMVWMQAWTRGGSLQNEQAQRQRARAHA